MVCDAVDVTTYHRGFHGDLNETMFVGAVSDKAKLLVQTTHECLAKAIAAGTHTHFIVYLSLKITLPSMKSTYCFLHVSSNYQSILMSTATARSHVAPLALNLWHLRPLVQIY